MCYNDDCDADDDGKYSKNNDNDGGDFFCINRGIRGTLFLEASMQQ